MQRGRTRNSEDKWKISQTESHIQIRLSVIKDLKISTKKQIVPLKKNSKIKPCMVTYTDYLLPPKQKKKEK